MFSNCVTLLSLASVPIHTSSGLSAPDLNTRPQDSKLLLPMLLCHLFTHIAATCPRIKAVKEASYLPTKLESQSRVQLPAASGFQGHVTTYMSARAFRSKCPPFKSTDLVATSFGQLSWTSIDHSVPSAVLVTGCSQSTAA